MKILISLLLAVLIFTACGKKADMPPRWEKSLDFDWRFHLGEANNNHNPDYDDSKWRLLDLPHDFSIEQGFDTTFDGGWRAGYTKAE